MNKQKVINYLVKSGIWVKDGKIAKADIQKVRKAIAQYEAEAEATPKTPKGKKLLQELKEGGFEVKSMGAEQYGTRRFIYVRFVSNEERLKAEKFLTGKGYKVSKKYWPGSGTAEVFIGNYNGKYDGHVEASERITLDEYSLLAEGVPFKELSDRTKFYIQDEYESLVDLDEDNYQSNIKELKAQKTQASMSRECFIFKAKDDQWYMHLANEEYGEYDDCTTYGPFPSEEATEKYLDNNHSNPGGYSVDDSGKKEVPTVSPNGRGIVKPGRSRW